MQNILGIMGLNIKEAIKKHGLEVKQVAERMEITPVGLSQHINGNPSVKVLEKIASAIGCDISELFDKPDENYMIMKVTCPHCGKVVKMKTTIHNKVKDKEEEGKHIQSVHFKVIEE